MSRPEDPARSISARGLSSWMHLVGSSPTNSLSVVSLTNPWISSTFSWPTCLRSTWALRRNHASSERRTRGNFLKRLSEPATSLLRAGSMLAIPEVGEETAHDLAKFHQSLEDVADSQLLRDVIALDGLRKEMASANPRAKSNRSKSQRERGTSSNVISVSWGGRSDRRRLMEAGFAERAKRKDARDSDAVTRSAQWSPAPPWSGFPASVEEKCLNGSALSVSSPAARLRQMCRMLCREDVCSYWFARTNAALRSAGNHPVSRRQCQRKR